MIPDPPSPHAPVFPQEPRLSMLNLVLGGIAFAIAAAMTGAALRLAGSQTLVGILAAISTSIAFLILWNLRIHRQPHGLFLCSSLLCLGGAAVALGHALYVGDLLRVQPKFDAQQPRVITTDSHLRRPLPEDRQAGRALPLPAPATAKPDSAPTPPKSPAWLAEWRASQAEVTRRYPIIGIRDSRENKAFVASYKALQKTNPAYFDEPDWPMRLAQALAERDGWERGDGIVDDSPVEATPVYPTEFATEPAMESAPPTEFAPALPDTPDTGFEDRSEPSLPASPPRF